MANLDDSFFEKLVEVYQKHGIDPTDALLVMFIESGVSPSAKNPHGGAAGLVQFMPATLKGLGASQDEIDNFVNLSGEEQLDWIDKLVASQLAMTKMSGFSSAVQYYQANFMPATVRATLDSNQVITEAGQPAYEYNKGLDYNKDGKITVGDLQTFLLSRAKNSAFKSLVDKLNQFGGKSYSELISELTDQSSLVDQSSNIAKKKDGLNEEEELDKEDELLSEPNSNKNREAPSDNDLADFLSMLGKATASSDSFLISINSNDVISSIEYFRVLSSILETEFLAKTTIHSNNNKAEMICKSSSLNKDYIEKICVALSNDFSRATIKIGSRNLKVSINNQASLLPELSFNDANRYYRQFKMKFFRK